MSLQGSRRTIKESDYHSGEEYNLAETGCQTVDEADEQQERCPTIGNPRLHPEGDSNLLNNYQTRIYVL